MSDPVHGNLGKGTNIKPNIEQNTRMVGVICVEKSDILIFVKYGLMPQLEKKMHIPSF